MFHKTFLTLPLTLALVLCAAKAAVAEPAARIMPSKITPVLSNDEDGLSKAAPDVQDSGETVNLASLVLVEPESEMTSYLKSQITSADDLVSVFHAFLPDSNSPTMNKSAINALSMLSVPVDADDQDTQKKIYELRLSKLMAFGALDKVRKLYTVNTGNSPSSGISEIGFTALFAGEKAGLACLEQNAVPPEFREQNPSFWNISSLMCQGLLSPAAGDDDALRLTNAYRIYATARDLKEAPDWNGLNKSHPLDIMAYGRLGYISKRHLSPQEIGKASTESLALILPNFNGELKDWAALLTESYKRGLLSPEEVRTRLNEKLAYLESLNLKRTVDDFEKTLHAYLSSNTAMPTSETLETIKNETGNYDLLAPLWLGAESPFGQMDHTEWKTYNHSQTDFILSVLLMANQPAPDTLLHEKWPLNPSAETEKQEENTNLPTDPANLICHYLLDKKEASAPKTAEIQAVCKVLDDAAPTASQKIQFYDNILDLTESGNYVMPTGDILSNLKKSAKKKPSLQMVIESLSMLTAQPIEKLNPAAMYLSLQAISSAGLSVETKSTGREVLGHILEN